jgi:tRNA-specific adenosine deaminase 1
MSTDSESVPGNVDNPDFKVALVHDLYLSLRFSPPNQQYTILASFILSCSLSGKTKVISLATGSKCLPATRLSPHGDSLNDSHAEVLARRGAILWFLEEVQRVRSSEPIQESPWIVLFNDGKYKLRNSVKLHMYISTVPCRRFQRSYNPS